MRNYSYIKYFLNYVGYIHLLFVCDIFRLFSSLIMTHVQAYKRLRHEQTSKKSNHRSHNQVFAKRRVNHSLYKIVSKDIMRGICKIMCIDKFYHQTRDLHRSHYVMLSCLPSPYVGFYCTTWLRSLVM